MLLKKKGGKKEGGGQSDTFRVGLLSATEFGEVSELIFKSRKTLHAAHANLQHRSVNSTIRWA